jgi:cytidylate kinase
MREGSLHAPIRHPVDWQNPAFYDEAKLDAELRRVFDICHGCRRCFNLCDSFPRLFDLIDATPSGELHDVKSQDFQSVIDACTLCDMCFMTKCPYVPPHEFDVDFPHLMLRHRAVDAKNHGVPFTDRELTKTDRNGELAKFAAPVANWATSTDNSFTRAALNRIAHIHPEAELPRYTSKPFVARAKESMPVINREAPAFGKRKAVIYATCTVNYNDPDLGLVARRVLAKNGIETEVVYPSCCGMPQLEQGDVAQVVANAKKVSAELGPWIAKGYDVIALVPSCALMFKLEWPLLVPQDDPMLPAVKRLAQATFDLTEYIVDIAKRHGLAPGMKPLAGAVALHIACHARAQNMGAKAEEVLKLLPKTEDGAEGITLLERCSGHGGSWGVKTENFEIALKIGKPVARKAAEVLKDAAEKNQAAFIASECPLAAAHIAQGVEKLNGAAKPPRAYNPVEIFAMSYGILRDDAHASQARLRSLYKGWMQTPPFIIAIDGPSASGKGTVAKHLAAHFGFAHLDTGLLYRAVGLAVLRAGGDPGDPGAVTKAARALDPAALIAADDPALREDATSSAASKVAAIPEVRTALLKFQQDFCAKPPNGKPGAVLDGRDIGTVIAPQAPVKIYVTASVEARAERRFKELQARGETVTYAGVLRDMQVRDARDAERAIAPAKPAADAVILDTTQMTADEAFAAALKIANAVLATNR